MSMEIKEELLDIEGIKNSNKPLLELFIRRTAVITSTPETLTEKIIKDQWNKANKATQPDSVIGEFDFCNLGTFYISKSKARKRIEKLDRISNICKDKNRVLKEKTEARREIIIKDNENLIRVIRSKTKQTSENEC